LEKLEEEDENAIKEKVYVSRKKIGNA